MGLRVPKSGVELQNPRATGSEHDARVQDAAELDPLAPECVDGGDEYIAADFLHDGVGRERSRAIGAHAAGVRANVAFTHLLVVLAWVEHGDGLAINQCDHAEFLTGEALFNDDC